MIAARSFSSLMRLKRRVPRWVMVSALSKGSLACITPPGKWQGWQRFSRMGRTSFSNVTGAAAG